MMLPHFIDVNEWMNPPAHAINRSQRKYKTQFQTATNHKSIYIKGLKLLFLISAKTPPGRKGLFQFL